MALYTFSGNMDSIHFLQSLQWFRLWSQGLSGLTTTPKLVMGDVSSGIWEPNSETTWILTYAAKCPAMESGQTRHLCCPSQVVNSTRSPLKYSTFSFFFFSCSINSFDSFVSTMTILNCSERESTNSIQFLVGHDLLGSVAPIFPFFVALRESFFINKLNL